MSAPPTSSPTTPPDPNQDRTGAVAAAPSRTARLLGLVRMLMDYGFELVCTLQRRAAPNDVSVSAMTRPFGTRNLALILARITRGLRLAGALEERLMRRPVPEEKKPAAPAPRRSANRAPPDRPPDASRIPTRVSRCSPRRSRSRRTSAAARSEPSSPISAAISAFCPATSCGGNCRWRSSTTAAASSGCPRTYSNGYAWPEPSCGTARPPHGRNRSHNSPRPAAQARPESRAVGRVASGAGPRLAPSL